MLELEDIQHFLLTRPRAMAARYGFLSFRRPDDGRAWLAGIIDRVGSGRAMSGRRPLGCAMGHRRVHLEWSTRAWAWTTRRWRHFPRSSDRAWPRARRSWEIPARTIRTTGWAVWRVPISTPS